MHPINAAFRVALGLTVLSATLFAVVMHTDFPSQSNAKSNGTVPPSSRYRECCTFAGCVAYRVLSVSVTVELANSTLREYQGNADSVAKRIVPRSAHNVTVDPQTLHEALLVRSRLLLLLDRPSVHSMLPVMG
jgi:hypothetical protein